MTHPILMPKWKLIERKQERKNDQAMISLQGMAEL